MTLLLCAIVLLMSGASSPGTVEYQLSGTVRESNMSTYSVNSRTAFLSALTNAKAGDTIVLADGEYGDITITNRKFTSNVSIVSANPSGAHFDTLKVSASSNISFEGLEIGGAKNVLNATVKAFVANSSNIKFSGIDFHGTLDGNAQNDSSGLRVLNSTFVSVKNSEFQQFLRGVTFNESSDIELVGNKFHDIRMDGSAFAAVQRVLIDSNHFTNFNRKLEDHSDAIQFWTTGTTKASTDIVIQNNQVLQGSGTSMQGIFMRDENGSLPYQRVTIKNNLVYESTYPNGIAVNNARDLTVSGNTIVSPRTDTSPVWIRLTKIAGGVIENNVTDTIVQDSNTGLTFNNNLELAKTAGSVSLLTGVNWGSTATVSSLLLSGIGYQPLGTGTAVDLSAATTTTSTLSTSTSTSSTTTVTSPTVVVAPTTSTSTTTTTTTTTTKPKNTGGNGNGKNNKSSTTLTSTSLAPSTLSDSLVADTSTSSPQTLSAKSIFTSSSLSKTSTSASVLSVRKSLFSSYSGLFART